MKGYVQKSEGEGNFFSIKHGSIVRTSKTPQEGFEKIEGENHRTKEKYTTYIQRFDTIEALITKIEWYDTEQKYNTRYQGFKLHLVNDAGTKAVLDLPINSRATGRFMKTAENLDFNKPVEFRAWHDSRSDSTAVFIGQDGASVPQKYTRENPNGLPEPTQDFKKNWDYSKQEEFLYRKMIDVVIPAVAVAHPNTQQSEPEQAEASSATTNGKLDQKTIERVKTALKDLSEHEEYSDRSRGELMEEFFDTTKFSEIETMPAETVKSVLKKIDEILIPF